MLSQLESHKALQAANHLHEYLLSHYYEIDLRDQLRSTLVSKQTPCFYQSCHPTVPRKSVRFTDVLEIRFQTTEKDGDTIFHRRQPI